MGHSLRLLIIEDSPEDTDILLRELNRCDFETEWLRVETAEEMISALEQRQWDIIISDFVMPLFNGLDALRIAKEKGLDLPFIICSGKLGEDAAVEAMHAGANDYLLKGNLKHLRHAIPRALAEAGERKQHREMEQELILLKQAIDAIPIGVTITDTTGRIIFTNPAEAQMHGYTVNELLGSDSRNLAPKTNWNEQKLPIAKYVTLIRESVNRRKDDSEFPVQLISLPVAYDQGSPVWAVTICEDITERKEVEKKLLFMSTHDALTGLYNRAYFEHELHRLDHSRHFPVSVIMMDVNGLKCVNDREGHQRGDLLLQEVGRILLEMFRTEDMVARIGGDEFIVLLPETDSQTVARAVARIRQYLEEGTQQDIDAPRVSLAIGAATAEVPGMLLDSIKQADITMYQDKIASFYGRRKIDQEATGTTD